MIADEDRERERARWRREATRKPESMAETNARLHAEADRAGVFDYVGVESVTVFELVGACPLCSRDLNPAAPWPSDCPLCRSPHKVCAGCGAHVRFGKGN